MLTRDSTIRAGTTTEKNLALAARFFSIRPPGAVTVYRRLLCSDALWHLGEITSDSLALESFP